MYFGFLALWTVRIVGWGIAWCGCWRAAATAAITRWAWWWRWWAIAIGWARRPKSVKRQTLEKQQQQYLVIGLHKIKQSDFYLFLCFRFNFLSIFFRFSVLLLRDSRSRSFCSSSSFRKPVNGVRYSVSESLLVLLTSSWISLFGSI